MFGSLVGRVTGAVRVVLFAVVALAIIAGFGKPAVAAPETVTVGAYINDIQQLDFKTNNYTVDLYVWFRWRDPNIRPDQSMEFMNRYASDDNLRQEFMDEPEVMPDGSFYSILRYQGRFSTKFNLEDYPFDTQTMTVIMEDTLSGASKLRYKLDGPQPVDIDPVLTLPGFRVGKPEMRVDQQKYPTGFGDLSVGDSEPYSRVVLSIPVTRPAVAMTIKTFVPILLIIVCASLVFFVRPVYVEGRIGLGITALLTLVALQLSATSGLPDVDYLTMLDKVYLLAYLFIILALTRIVATSWKGELAEHEKGISRNDRRWVVWLLSAYLFANVLVAVSSVWMN